MIFPSLEREGRSTADMECISVVLAARKDSDFVGLWGSSSSLGGRNVNARSVSAVAPTDLKQTNLAKFSPH